MLDCNTLANYKCILLYVVRHLWCTLKPYRVFSVLCSFFPTVVAWKKSSCNSIGSFPGYRKVTLEINLDKIWWHAGWAPSSEHTPGVLWTCRSLGPCQRDTLTTKAGIPQLHRGGCSLCLPCSPAARSLAACSSSSDDCHSWIIFYGPLSSCIAEFKRQKERGGGRMHGWMGRQEEWAAGSTQCSGQWADVFHYRVLLWWRVWWRAWYHTNDTYYHSIPLYWTTMPSRVK